MDIFNKITAEEQEAICNYIHWYGGSDGCEAEMKVPLKQILRFWSKNKEKLATVLGGKLILSKEINFQRPTELIEDDVANVLDGEGWNFYRNYEKMIERLCGEYRYWSDCDSPNEILRSGLQDLINTSTLADNIYTGRTFTIPSLHGHDVTVNKGSKASKMLGKIAVAQDLEGFEEFRIAHSMCLNQKSMHGKMCLSIHPLDYMTMSDNNCDWESCMSWQNDGSYRQGTVEMMNSGAIVIVYLASENPMTVRPVEWSNKKWRQLFVVTPEMIMGIRQYPYYSEECEGIALNWLRELAQRNAGWGPYCKNVAKISNDDSNIFAEINQTSRISLYMNHMYNDIGCNQRGYISVDFPESFYLNLSGESECMTCGEIIDEDADDEMLVCYECSGIRICSRCGERIYDYDNIFYLGDDCYCCDCINEVATSCEVCEEMTDNDEIQEVYMKHNGVATGYYIEVCDCCLNSDSFKSMFGEAHRERLTGTYWESWVVDSKNFDSYGWSSFLPSPSTREAYQATLGEES